MIIRCKNCILPFYNLNICFLCGNIYKISLSHKILIQRYFVINKIPKLQSSKWIESSFDADRITIVFHSRTYMYEENNLCYYIDIWDYLERQMHCKLMNKDLDEQTIVLY